MNRSLDVRKKLSLISVVERWKDKYAPYKNKPVEIWEFEGTSKREYTY